MALPLQAFTVVEVRKPNVGEAKPAAVTADVLLDTKSAHSLSILVNTLPSLVSTNLPAQCGCLVVACDKLGMDPTLPACLHA